MVAGTDGGDHGVVDGMAEDKAGRMLSPWSFSTSRPIGARRSHSAVIPSSPFEMRQMPPLPRYSETVFLKTSTVVCLPLVTNPRFARITDPEMKKLMIESSAKLAHWLCLREMLLEEKPEAYYQLLRAVGVQGIAKLGARSAKLRSIGAGV